MSYNGPGTLSYTFSASFPASEDAFINSSTGVFVWNTMIESAGTFTVTIQASAGTNSDSTNFVLIV